MQPAAVLLRQRVQLLALTCDELFVGRDHLDAAAQRATHQLTGGLQATHDLHDHVGPLGQGAGVVGQQR